MNPLVKELKHAGLPEIVAANRWIREDCLPSRNAGSARPAAVAEKPFVAVDPALTTLKGSAGRARQYGSLMCYENRTY